MHGFGIGRWIPPVERRRAAHRGKFLYPALYRMEQRGWIEASWGLSENQRHAKFYQLTAVGRRRLQKNAHTWSSFAQAVARVLGAKQRPA